ncbi:MAG: hypothetical protein JNN18_19060 [Rubrivivax sp.]|nr:hypothetical protein [Rubrivivax sp.]
MSPCHAAASSRRPALVVVAGVAAVLLPLLAQAQPAPVAPPAASIYSCIDDKGRRLTSDRPIPECNAREQRVLNRDGSLRDVRPPTLTAEERAEAEARERKAAEVRQAQAEATRRDRNLVARYKDAAAHGSARAAALDTVKLAIAASEKRLKELAAERKPLLDEAEFYKGKPLPAKLKQMLDANEVATSAQREAVAAQEAELVRVNRLYDIELDRLKKLWAGAAPGSLGPMPTAMVGGATATR